MTGQISTGGFHQEVVHGLVDAGAALDEPVLDRLQRCGDPDLEARLLGHLAQGRLLGGLAGVRRALRQRPGQSVGLAPAAAHHEMRKAVLIPDDDATGGCCRGVPQARHGAEAALARRARPAPNRAQRMTTTGCRRPATGAYGRAGVTDRQRARSRTSGLRSASRSTVARRVAGWNVTAAPRPRRRSRARDDGRTNRAAGRAAYFAAMLCCMGAIVPRQAPFASDAASPRAASGVSAPRASASASSRRPRAR